MVLFICLEHHILVRGGMSGSAMLRLGPDPWGWCCRHGGVPPAGPPAAPHVGAADPAAERRVLRPALRVRREAPQQDEGLRRHLR